MFCITVEDSFDSAHFLAGYEGKCANLHGHRWRVILEVSNETLIEAGQERGMICDFGILKSKLKEVTNNLDHSFIFEEGSLKPSTITALENENFKLIPVAFRPTAENFCKYFYDIFKQSGYNISKVTVYETPNNCATYCES